QSSRRSKRAHGIRRKEARHAGMLHQRKLGRVWHSHHRDAHQRRKDRDIWIVLDVDVGCRGRALLSRRPTGRRQSQQLGTSFSQNCAPLAPRLAPSMDPTPRKNPPFGGLLRIAGEGLIRDPATDLRAWAVWDLAHERWLDEGFW